MKKEEREELISERISQIYAEAIHSKELEKIRIEEREIGIMFEEMLKEKDEKCFENYCKYEEVQSKYTLTLLRKYYEQGLNDGIKLITEAK